MSRPSLIRLDERRHATRSIRALAALILGGMLNCTRVQATDDVDRYVTTRLLSGRVPGAAIAVVQGGHVIKEVLYGRASVQLDVPVRRTTRFQLASVTKTFTGLTLLLLQQAGRLDLNDEVSKYMDDLPNSWRGIRLAELATHTSGLPDVIRSPDLPLSNLELARSEGEALRFATSQPLRAAPGARYEYNQTNFMLLKRVIERVSGSRFRPALISRLALSSSSMFPWGDCRVVIAGRSDMYTAIRGQEIENGTDLFRYPKYLEAAAGLNASIVEMGAFGSELTGGSMLNSKSLDVLLRPVRRRDGGSVDMGSEGGADGAMWPSIGLLYGDNSDGKFPRLFFAGGSATSIIYYPRQQLLVAVLTNLQAHDDPLAIAEGVAGFYLDGLHPMFDRTAMPSGAKKSTSRAPPP